MQESLTLVRPNGSEFSVDMTELRRLEARQSEASGCGRMQALSLMTDMKEGYEIAGTMRSTIGLERDRARQQVAMRKAVVCLDIVPELLKSKGLATPRSPGGSAEQRDDVLALDVEHGKLLDYAAQLDAAYQLAQVKMESFRMAYSTAKRNFDDTLPGMLPKGYNGGAMEPARDASSYGRSRDPMPMGAPRPAQAWVPTVGTGQGLSIQASQQVVDGNVITNHKTPAAPVDDDFGILIGKARY